MEMTCCASLRLLRLRAAIAAVLWAFAAGSAAAAALESVAAKRPALSADERATILSHGPWPPRATRDPSNRVAGSATAAQWGRQLFFDTRLSITGTIACSSCHIPEFAFTDRRPVATGLAVTDRNTPSVVDARFNRWFGWAGATDSLWAASLRPLADPREMGSAERHVVERMRGERDLACGYRQVFGAEPQSVDDARLFADVGKALDAFQSTLVSGRTAFDDYRDALARGDRRAQARYPADALRGLQLFVGRAQCNVCHLGAQFTNHEFDKVGIPVRRPDGRIDWGRHDGIKALQSSRFSLLGRFNDDARRRTARSTQHVALTNENYGQFRVPSLRNVARTAPYMHDGSLATLTDVVRHYSTIDAVKLHLAAPHPHADPGEELPARPTESVLRTLNLSEREIADLVAFLETLSERSPRPVARGEPLRACR
jgi:cytochrome c peroxidase